MGRCIKTLLVTTAILILNFSILLNAQINIDSLKQCLSSAQSDTAKASILYCIGKYYLLNDPSKALCYYNQSEYLFSQSKDTAYWFYSLIGLNDLYSNNGDYTNAINILNKAQLLTKNDIELAALYYNRLALLYDQMGKADLSVQNDKLALACYEQLNDSLSIACSLHNIGDYYLDINQLDSAQLYLEKCKIFCTDSTDIMVVYNLALLSVLEQKKGNYNLSIKLGKKVSQRYLADSLWYDVANTKKNIAECFIKLNIPDSSFIYANQSVEIAQKLHNIELLKENYNFLYKLYEQKKDYKNALTYSVLEKNYADSLQEKNKENIIQNFSIKEKLTKQEELLEQTQIINKHLNKQRTLLIFFSLIVFLLFVVVFYLFVQKRKEQNKNTELLKELNTVNDTLRTILSIIGHDLKGSIGSLKTFTEYIHLKLLDKKSIEELIKDFVPMVEASSDLLDNLLTWSKNNNENFIPKKDKIYSNEIIDRTLIHVQYISHIKNIEFEIEDEQICFVADTNMTNIVLRNLVTNAIKFSEAGSVIKIKSGKTDYVIEFSVTDHGVGMTEYQISHIFHNSLNYHTKGTMGEKGSGLGLSLCNSFIQKQNGSLSVESKPGKGSTFKFTLPLNNINRETGDVCSKVAVKMEQGERRMDMNQNNKK